MSLDFLQNVMQACFRFFFRVLYTLYFISFLNGFLGEKERMQCYHYVTTPVHNEWHERAPNIIWGILNFGKCPSTMRDRGTCPLKSQTCKVEHLCLWNRVRHFLVLALSGIAVCFCGRGSKAMLFMSTIPYALQWSGNLVGSWSDDSSPLGQSTTIPCSLPSSPHFFPLSPPSVLSFHATICYKGANKYASIHLHKQIIKNGIT